MVSVNLLIGAPLETRPRIDEVNVCYSMVDKSTKRDIKRARSCKNVESGFYNLAPRHRTPCGLESNQNDRDFWIERDLDIILTKSQVTPKTLQVMILRKLL